ncbi:D-sedoheptulose 7-phosphate isomerase [Tistlia consotensis]|uniref:D-sedoheptulose 7-phosphate isomerase n=1 Tax=Tistlia consotensis USBA 355 TaxID=560819 RepID=A0A1Y6C1F9_9PROT|nr:SIS domain-containing protein [Tistlia consotensis]SMF30616.1 D-sedoheptulose 7-phosphate isomerase [Tistlia consotensis USBA 355]SNS19922.1 D-sedoheptulose 7-phosphate isomerase [Tistlia consotensis]
MTSIAEDTLGSLYPFLYGERRDERDLAAGLVESLRRKAGDSVEVKRRFFEENAEAVVAVARAIAGVYRGGGRLFTMGNGGSFCDAAHIAVEFQHPVTAGRPALPATCLTADVAVMTAVGNDVGFEHVYLRQIVAHGRAGDGLIGVSTSGNSANLMAAFDKAKALGLTTVGLAGMAGGAMARSASLDHCLVVPSDSIHRIQECHVAIYHILWDLVHSLLADTRGGLAAGSGPAEGAAP